MTTPTGSIASGCRTSDAVRISSPPLPSGSITRVSALPAATRAASRSAEARGTSRGTVGEATSNSGITSSGLVPGRMRYTSTSVDRPEATSGETRARMVATSPCSMPAVESRRASRTDCRLVCTCVSW